MSRRRVVVTGLGATTPLGGDVASSWSALLAGRSGVRTLTDEWASTISVTIAGRVEVEPSEAMERVEMRRLDRSEQFALIAAREAWKDAGSPDVDLERLGVVIASGIGGVTTLLDQYDILKNKGARFVSPHTVPMLMPNGPAANVGLELKAKAGVHTPVSACASGAEAIGYAMEMIRFDRADIIVTGGVEAAVHALPMAAFAAMKALSTRNDDPKRASRPYDVDRDGFVLGEGGGVAAFQFKGADGAVHGAEGGGGVVISVLTEVDRVAGEARAGEDLEWLERGGVRDDDGADSVFYDADIGAGDCGGAADFDAGQKGRRHGGRADVIQEKPGVGGV